MGGGLDDRALRRIIALLVSFAVLAERAARRSLPVRWLVFAVIRYAERVARDVLVDETGWDWIDIDDAFGIGGDPNGLLGSGNGPADAAVLAWRLRTLAALLRTLLRPAVGLERGTARDDRQPSRAEAALRRFASRLALLLAAPDCRARWHHDTS
jgi:hypothetical protein